MELEYLYEYVYVGRGEELTGVTPEECGYYLSWFFDLNDGSLYRIYVVNSEFFDIPAPAPTDEETISKYQSRYPWELEEPMYYLVRKTLASVPEDIAKAVRLQLSLMLAEGFGNGSKNESKEEFEKHYWELL